MTDVTSLTVQFDTQIPAIYVYLRDPKGFRAARSLEVGPGVVADLDTNGKLIGVELLGPGSLEVVFKKVMRRFKAPQLRQLHHRERMIKELLKSGF